MVDENYYVDEPLIKIARLFDIAHNSYNKLFLETNFLQQQFRKIPMIINPLHIYLKNHKQSLY